MEDHANIVVNRFLELSATDSSLRIREFTREYADKEGLNAMSLLKYIYKVPGCPEPEHHSQKLSNEQERLIACASLVRSRMKLALRPKALARVAFDYFGVQISLPTAAALIRRQSDVLRLKNGKVVTKARVGTPLLADIYQFVDVFERVQATFPVTADSLINVDESRVAAGRDGSTGYQVVTGLDDHGDNVSIQVDTTKLSILPFVTASGKCLMVAIIVKAPKSVKDDEDANVYLVLDQGEARASRRLSAAPWQYYYCVTGTGYVNRAAYLACCRKFADLWQKHYPGLWCWVLADQLEVHKDAAIVKEMMEHHIFFLYFAKNCTHFLQPLDGLVFAAFKRRFRMALEQLTYDAAVSGGSSKGLVYNATYRALEHAMTPKTISKSWQQRGVWPFDRELILIEAEKWVGAQREQLDNTRRASRVSDVDIIVSQTKEISRIRSEAAARRVSEVHATLPLNVVVTGDDVLDQAARKKSDQAAKAAEAKAKSDDRKRKREVNALKKQEKALAKRQRELDLQARRDLEEAIKIAHTCRGPCKRRIKSNMLHVVCKCNNFMVCAKCDNAQPSLMKKHKRTCKAK